MENKAKTRRKPPNAGIGRIKGVPNRNTKLLKDAILKAACKAGQKLDKKSKDGLVTYLTEQARKNPGPFMSLLGKVLPMQVTGMDNGPLETITRIELVAPTPDDQGPANSSD